MQRILACGISLGLSKREIMEDYALDELFIVLDEYAEQKKQASRAPAADAEDF